MSLTRSSKRAIKARHDRAAANQTMLVTTDEAQMLLRLRQLANAHVVEARVALPDLKVETVDSRAIMSVLHGNV
jgi:hypothetical protein